jgi:hypothetical protein
MWGSAKGLQIDPGESADLGACPCCGNMGRSVWGYVSKEKLARAVYYARWIDKHLDRGVQILLSIGSWGETSNVSMRRMVAVECRMGEGRPTFMIVDAARMPWADEELLGKGLTREQVINDPVKDEIFSIVDQVTFEDWRIKEFLRSESTPQKAPQTNFSPPP